MPRPFHIVTISNDLPAYQQMRASMAAAGFNDQTCRFTVRDNSAGNRHDPYQVLRDLPSDGDEPYYVLCHQDLRFDGTARFDQLRAVAVELDHSDPNWAVAGTAGITMRGKQVLHLDDPTGSYRSPGLPRRVVTLDENFLLVRRATAPVPSPGLRGFHLYGTDLCLTAVVGRRTCYVIDFPLTHLSGGTTSPAFYAGRDALIDSWRPRLCVGLVRTTCADLHISRYHVLERALARPWFRRPFLDGGYGLITRHGRVCREPRPPPELAEHSPPLPPESGRPAADGGPGSG